MVKAASSVGASIIIISLTRYPATQLCKSPLAIITPAQWTFLENSYVGAGMGMVKSRFHRILVLLSECALLCSYFTHRELNTVPSNPIMVSGLLAAK